MKRAARLLLVLAGLASAAPAQDVVLKPGWVLQSPQAEPLEGVTFLVREGKLAAIDHTLEAPPGVPVVELPGSWVIAGLIDPWSGLGARGAPGETARAISGDVLAGEQLDRRHPDWAAARAAGITTALLSPGEACLIPGWGRLVRTSGVPLPEADPVLRLLLGEAGLERDRAPTTRSGALALLRQALGAAHAEEGEAALRPFARGERAGLCSVESTADLRAALELQTAFGLKLLVQLAPSLTVDDLEGLDIGPATTFVLGPWDLRAPAACLRVAAALHARGVPLAFTGHPPFGPPGGARLSAALAVRHGLPARAALAALTTQPAAALGIGERAGSLEIGRPADLVVLDGPPLDLRSRVIGTWIGGRRVYPNPAGREETP